MTTTTNVLPPPVQQRFLEKILSTPQARLIFSSMATQLTMDERSGDIMRMRRYTRLATAPVPLGPDMQNPPSQLLTAVDLDARIDWYGTYLIITRQVTLINEDPKRRNGVYKFPLIDLEILQQDDRAQATYECAA